MIKRMMLMFFLVSSITYGEEGRMRVNPEDLIFEKGQIFVQTAGGLQSIRLLSAEPTGLVAYYSSPDLGLVWKCSECKTWNVATDDSCSYCGEPR